MKARQWGPDLGSDSDDEDEDDEIPDARPARRRQLRSRQTSSSSSEIRAAVAATGAGNVMPISKLPPMLAQCLAIAQKQNQMDATHGN